MRASAGLAWELELLTTIVATGSFVGAARRVGMTQSGVSRGVARLEERVGVRLFDRTARAVTLTDDGKRFHERVAPLLGALEDAVDGAASAATEVRGRLRVNADAFLASHVLGPRLPAFLAAHPALEVEVTVTERPRNLVSEGFDVAVRFGPPEGEGVIARRLLETRIITCAAPSYLERHGVPRHPRDLTRGHECILFADPRTGRPFDWEFHAGRRRITHLPVRGRLVVNDVATALAACAAGQGVAQPLALGLDPLLRDGRLVEILTDWQDELFPLYVTHPSRHLPPARVRAFLDFVVESTKEGALRIRRRPKATRASSNGARASLTLGDRSRGRASARLAREVKRDT
jgi:DNA-binding transcriptional LysR family regulator